MSPHLEIKSHRETGYFEVAWLTSSQLNLAPVLFPLHYAIPESTSQRHRDIAYPQMI